VVVVPVVVGVVVVVSVVVSVAVPVVSVGVDVVVSPFLHTRMIVKDGSALLLGAAGNPGAQPGSRELAVLTTDPATAQAAREAFLRMLEEARSGKGA
jgi:hypothetical protein